MQQTLQEPLFFIPLGQDLRNRLSHLPEDFVAAVGL